MKTTVVCLETTVNVGPSRDKALKVSNRIVLLTGFQFLKVRSMMGTMAWRIRVPGLPGDRLLASCSLLLLVS